MIRTVSTLHRFTTNEPTKICFFCFHSFANRQRTISQNPYAPTPFDRWPSRMFGGSSSQIAKHSLSLASALHFKQFCTKAADSNSAQPVEFSVFKAVEKTKTTKKNRKFAQDKRGTVSKLAKIHFDNPALEIFEGMKYADVLESQHPYADRLFSSMPRQVQRAFTRNGLSVKQLVEYLKKADIRHVTVTRLLPPEPYQPHPEEIPVDLRSCPSATPVVRPAVVTILGHVDHGKTTLLDCLRNSRLIEGESGGITQRIGAFTLKLPHRDTTVTFIDTPGHAAFDRMRERGTQCTDLVILIVAADDGVMTQTEQCIDFINKYKTPFIVAITKIDKSNARVERVEEQLAEFGIEIEKLGGTVPCVPISIYNNQTVNMEELIDTIDCQAELLQPLCDVTARTEGVVIEANTDPLTNEKVASIIVKQGTLKPGQCLICGDTVLKVRKIGDENGRKMDSVSPGRAANVFGWKSLPQPGDYAMQVSSEKVAKEIMQRKQEYRQSVRQYESALEAKETSRRHREAYVQTRLASDVHFGELKKMQRIQHYENLKKAANVEKTPSFNLFVRADNQGSLEAIMNVLDTFETPYCTLNVLDQGVGTLSETDLELARSLENSLVMYFNLDESHIRAASSVTIDDQSTNSACNEVLLISEKVIYQLISNFKEVIEQNVAKEPNDVIVGEAIVKEIFKISSTKSIIAGCKVTRGRLDRKNLFKLLRDEEEVVTGNKVTSLKQMKNDVMAIESGRECGLVFENYNDIQKGDIIQCYEVEMRTPNIDWDPKF